MHNVRVEEAQCVKYLKCQYEEGPEFKIHIKPYTIACMLQSISALYNKASCQGKTGESQDADLFSNKQQEIFTQMRQKCDHICSDPQTFTCMSWHMWASTHGNVPLYPYPYKCTHPHTHTPPHSLTNTNTSKIIFCTVITPGILINDKPNRTLYTY